MSLNRHDGTKREDCLSPFTPHHNCIIFGQLFKSSNYHVNSLKSIMSNSDQIIPNNVQTLSNIIQTVKSIFLQHSWLPYFHLIQRNNTRISSDSYFTKTCFKTTCFKILYNYAYNCTTKH